MIKNKIIKFIVFVLILCNFLEIKSNADTDILNINNKGIINITIKQNCNYILPNYVLYKDKGKNKRSKILWNIKLISTSKLGKKTVYGNIEDSPKKVTLIANVVKWILPIKDIEENVSSLTTFALKIRDTIEVTYSDGSKGKVPIIWETGPSKYYNNKLYYNTYFGTVKGYNKKVKLTVFFD